MHCCRAGNVQELDHRMGILVVADMKFCMHSAKFSLRARKSPNFRQAREWVWRENWSGLQD